MGEYLILYCFDRSSNDVMGVSNRETVKKAAKLAVYEAMMMNPKSHLLKNCIAHVPKS